MTESKPQGNISEAYTDYFTHRQPDMSVEGIDIFTAGYQAGKAYVQSLIDVESVARAFISAMYRADTAWGTFDERERDVVLAGARAAIRAIFEAPWESPTK